MLIKRYFATVTSGMYTLDWGGAEHHRTSIPYGL
jgi:hypothetical protein